MLMVFYSSLIFIKRRKDDRKRIRTLQDRLIGAARSLHRYNMPAAILGLGDVKSACGVYIKNVLPEIVCNKTLFIGSFSIRAYSLLMKLYGKS